MPKTTTKKKKSATIENCIAKYSKSSGYSKSILRQVGKRGMGAYFSGGSRAGQTPTSWACGRIRSFATGSGGARKADADLLKKARTKKRKA